MLVVPQRLYAYTLTHTYIYLYFYLPIYLASLIFKMILVPPVVSYLSV